MRWWKPYEPLLEQRPVQAIVAVQELIAKELCDVFETFPPAEEAVSWEDPRLAARWRGRLHELPRPDVALVELVGRVVCLDLAHEIEAIEHLLRNDHHRPAAPTPAHVEALHLLWRVTMELLEARKEDCRGVLRRKDLPPIVEQAVARFRAKRLGPAG